MCNTCKIGKVRPIQFSLKQAIINCDNPACESYLEKWPWECIITRPILNSSDLCKYEKESTCSSSDSSGVQSDLGSSGVSQYSATDREVETLLQKSYTSDFDFESVEKTQNTLQWQTLYSIQEQEPFLALDDKMLSTDMPSHSEENIFESNLNLLPNNFQREEECENDGAKNKQEFLALLGDSGFGGSSGIATNNNQSKDTHLRINEDNDDISDLESWLSKLESSDLFPNSSVANCNNVGQPRLENEKDSSCISPSKTLIPSINSAFSEVSPSKLGLLPYENKIHNTHEPIKHNDDYLKFKLSSVPNSFLSPASSGFNEDCIDQTVNKPVLSTESSLPNELAALELQNHSRPSSSPEQNEITSDLSDEISDTPETHVNTQTVEERDSHVPLQSENVLNINNNLQRKRGRPRHIARNKTKCKSIVTDPWSVPEVYIDELDIEVVLRNESTSVSPPNTQQKDEHSQKKLENSHLEEQFRTNSENNHSEEENSTKSENSHLEEKNRIMLENIHLDKQSRTKSVNSHSEEQSHSLNSLLGSEENASHNSMDVNLSQNNFATSYSPLDNFLKFSQLNSSQSQCQAVSETISSNSQVDDFCKTNTIESDVINSASQVVDLYKPITLKPEVVNYHSYFDAAAINYSDSSKLRLSVGYKTEANNETNFHFTKENEVENEKESNNSSGYFSSILSNIDFDENFCLIENKERGTSLEDFVSSRFLSTDSDSEGLITENNNNSNYNKNNEVEYDEDKGKVGRENVCVSQVKDRMLDEHKMEGPIADISFKSEEYDSESEIPIITVDENDDLKLFLPVKEEKEEEKELELLNHNLMSIQDYSRKKRIKRRNLNSSRIPKTLSGCFPIPSNFCGHNLNVIDTHDHLYSRPSTFNVNEDSFTMFQHHDKFGSIKKEPEYFETFSNVSNDSLNSFDNFDGSNSPLNIYNSEDSNPPLRFLRETNDFVESKIHVNQKIKKKCKVFKTNSYRHKLKDPQCDNYINSDFDTTFVKPFKNLPSKRNRRRQNFKKSYRSNSPPLSSVSSLGENPSVPDVLKLLKESGWEIIPCDPLINYKIPEHATSPSIVPVALQDQYGNMGSDMVMWSLTDREVTVPNIKSNTKKKNNMNMQSDINTKGLADGKDIHIKKLCKFPMGKKPFNKMENHTFNDLNNFCSLEPPSKRKKKDLSSSPFQIFNDLNLPESSDLKTFKTKDGSVYIQPSFNKREPLDNNNSNQSNDSLSEECIELPDDYLAYQEAIKNGYNVSAPPTQLKNLYIPPLPVKQKIKPRRKTKDKYNNVTKVLNPVEKAQHELTTIVSERPPNEVPDVVCMNIEGKLYVYHRKDS